MSGNSKSDRRAMLLAEIESSGDEQLQIGRIAESFRNSASYRKAAQIFISPSPLLAQLRMNALADGKELVMPGPGLRDGFFLFKPYSVPFTKIPLAISKRGLPEYGTRLASAEVHDLDIELLVTDALVVDRKGILVGDGKGYFDLAVALLREMNGLKSNVATVVIPRCSAVLEELLSPEPWDVAADMAFVHDGAIRLDADSHQSCRQAAIHWDQLELGRIKKINSLWYLHNKKTKD